jgi:hypothetical protein
VRHPSTARQSLANLERRSQRKRRGRNANAGVAAQTPGRSANAGVSKFDGVVSKFDGVVANSRSALAKVEPSGPEEIDRAGRPARRRDPGALEVS